eukprot:2460265-Pyramimonas_sp.AAC.1
MIRSMTFDNCAVSYTPLDRTGPISCGEARPSARARQSATCLLRQCAGRASQAGLPGYLHKP